MWPQIARTLCPPRTELRSPAIHSGCQLGSQGSHRAALTTARLAGGPLRNGGGGMGLSSLIVLNFTLTLPEPQPTSALPHIRQMNCSMLPHPTGSHLQAFASFPTWYTLSSSPLPPFHAAKCPHPPTWCHHLCLPVSNHTWLWRGESRMGFELQLC